MLLCSNCKKRPAIVFITSKQSRDNLCLICAKEKNIPQVTEYMKHMGITDDKLDSIVNSTAQSEDAVDLKQMIEHQNDQWKKASYEQAEKQYEEIHKRQLEQEEQQRAILEKRGELCAFCQKRKAAVFSRESEYGLCNECAWLFYPQMDVQKATIYNIAIEDAIAGRIPPQKCDICEIRSSQIHNTDGDYCIVCAKKMKIPEADKFAIRMGMSVEALETFAQKVSSTEQNTNEEEAIKSKEPQSRFRVVSREEIDGKRIIVVLDSETGVQYLTNAQFSSFSPLFGKDGKVLIVNNY